MIGVENNLALKEELEIVKEEALMKDEELNKYQRHCHSLSDEVCIACVC